MVAPELAIAFVKDYRKWVKENVGAVTELESLLKLSSYLISGKSPKTQWLSELMYAASNLVTLANDWILRDSVKPDGFSESTADWLRVGLSVLEYVEVLLETFSERLFGDPGKWIIVCILQICRTIWRAALVLTGRCGIITSPLLKKLDREKLKTLPMPNESCSNPNVDEFTVLRSGRRMRKLEGAPPANMRTWKLPANVPRGRIVNEEVCSKLSSRQLMAEMIYISRPLTHLFLMFTCGQKSWKPWVTALALDCTSLALHRQEMDKFQPQEREELVNRSISLLVYLMRSPFYDKWTKTRLLGVLATISRLFRPAGMICDPLARYLPEWQRTYFYVWSS